MLKKNVSQPILKNYTAKQVWSGRTGPNHKNLARKQDGPRFSDPKVWTENDGYAILIGPDHEIDVLPAYSAHYHL
jgi:hypothetical protein